MKITRKTAREIINGEYTGTGWELIQIADNGVSEDEEGIEKFCILKHVATEILYRFVYVEYKNAVRFFFKNIQLTRVIPRDITITVYDDYEENEV